MADRQGSRRIVAVQEGFDLGIDGIDDGVEIGAGGFGVVFRALQVDRGRTVAVRLLPARPEAALRRRYVGECEILRAVSAHHNLVTLVAAGVTSVDQPFLIMEYMPNGSLADRVERDGRVPWSEAVSIIAKLADALAVAHAAGIQHRDIRPENVLSSSVGEPCLADLGLSRLLDIVEARTAPVSLLHAAPEVVEGRRPTELADIYSLGSTLFMMLAGSPAFAPGPEEAMNVVLGRIQKAPVPDLRRRGVPDAVCDVVEAAMAKSPAARPDSAVALGDRLRAALDAGAPRVFSPPITAPRPVIPPVVSVPEPEPTPPPEPEAVLPEPEPDPAPPEPEPAPPPPAPAPDPIPPEPVPVPVVPEPDPIPPEPEPVSAPPVLAEPEPEPEPAPVAPPAPTPGVLAGSIVPTTTTPEPEPESDTESEVVSESASASLPETTTETTTEPDPELPAAEAEPTDPVVASASDDVVPPAVTTEPIVIEGEPDESSRRRGRLVRFGLGAIVALVSLITLVVVVLDSTSTKVGTPTATDPTVETSVSSAATEPDPVSAEPFELPAVLMPSGIVVARTWTLGGTNGSEFSAAVDISNPTAKPQTDAVIEVIPKQLASNVSTVTFTGGNPVVVNQDPIVRWDVTLQPGERKRVGYTITVPGNGRATSRLEAWKTARDAEQAAFDAVINAPLPRANLKPGG